MYSSLHHGKRRFPRAAIESSAQVAVGLERFPATVKQISEGGLRLETDRELPHARMVVAFELPGFGEQRVVSEICWQRTAPHGYGCRFKEMPLSTQANIASYVKKMKRLYTEVQLAIALGKPRAFFEAQLREVKLDHLRDLMQLKDAVSRAMEALQSSSH